MKPPALVDGATFDRASQRMPLRIGVGFGIVAMLGGQWLHWDSLLVTIAALFIGLLAAAGSSVYLTRRIKHDPTLDPGLFNGTNAYRSERTRKNGGDW